MKPTGGRILMDGTLYSDPSRSLPPEKRDMGMVFQSFALWPHMTVRQHVEFPLQCRNKDLSAAEKEKRIAHALEATGLNGLEDRYPDELSGGQKQRVSLARAIVSGPSLLLMDEPLSALDADLRISMRKEISRIHRLTGTTVIFVTHDQGEALSLSDRIMVLNGGRIEQLGTPQDIYLRPATKFIASFIGRCNFVKGDWNGDTFRAGEGSFVFQGAPWRTCSTGTTYARSVRSSSASRRTGADSPASSGRSSTTAGRSITPCPARMTCSACTRRLRKITPSETRCICNAAEAAV